MDFVNKGAEKWALLSRQTLRERQIKAYLECLLKTLGLSYSL